MNMLWDYYRHLFPDFSIHHAIIYKMLWRVEPISGEEIAKQADLSKTTVYNTLRDLILAGLINRTSFKPVGYYANNPIKAYSSSIKKVVKKLETGVNKLETLLNNSSGLSGELYLVKRDGGQQKLIIKQNRGVLDDTEQLLQIKRVVEEQLKEVDKQRLKSCTIYK